MKRALIADDSGMARTIIRRCLEIVGGPDWEFIEADSGETAYKILREVVVNLVVTDLNMPVLDGLQLVHRIRASPKLNGLPVVVVTSDTNPEVIKRFNEAGAAAIVSKPVSPAKLASAMSTLNAALETP